MIEPLNVKTAFVAVKQGTRRRKASYPCMKGLCVLVPCSTCEMEWKGVRARKLFPDEFDFLQKMEICPRG